MNPPDEPSWSADTTPIGRGTEKFEAVVELPRDNPQGSLLLRGARVITMRGDEIIENADILIRDNRISKVGSRGSFDIPADAHVVDLSGSTIVPGFIDMHPHWYDIRRGVLDPDFRPVALQLLGDDHRQRRHAPLAHLGARVADQDRIVGIDRDPGVDLVGVVGVAVPGLRRDGGGYALSDPTGDSVLRT